MEAIPHELIIIGGAAAGALIIGNSGKELKALGGGLVKVFKGPKYRKQDYLDTIFLVSKLMKMLRMEGPIALEPHVERSEEHTSELQSLMRISYAVFCLKKKKKERHKTSNIRTLTQYTKCQINHI